MGVGGKKQGIMPFTHACAHAHTHTHIYTQLQLRKTYNKETGIKAQCLPILSSMSFILAPVWDASCSCSFWVASWTFCKFWTNPDTGHLPPSTVSLPFNMDCTVLDSCWGLPVKLISICYVCLLLYFTYIMQLINTMTSIVEYKISMTQLPAKSLVLFPWYHCYEEEPLHSLFNL